MNYGKTLLHILCAGGGMVIAITGLAYITEYFPSNSPKMGYAFLVLGGAMTLYFLAKLKKD